MDPVTKENLIDRTLMQPVYLQLADFIHQRILDGEYAPGQRLPSEAMLVEEYSVSPMTVRRAINYLAAQDVINTHKGKGTFVKSVVLEDAAFYLRSISEVFGSDEGTKVQVLEASFVLADEKIARKLDVRIGDKVIFLQRLITIDDEKAFFHREYLFNSPTQPIIEAELDVTDLKGFFHGSGGSLIKFGEISIESAILLDDEAALLGCPEKSAGMILEHTFFGFDDRPISWGWFVCESKRLKLKTWVGLTMNEGVRDERKR